MSSFPVGTNLWLRSALQLRADPNGETAVDLLDRISKPGPPGTVVGEKPSAKSLGKWLSTSSTESLGISSRIFWHKKYFRTDPAKVHRVLLKYPFPGASASHPPTATTTTRRTAAAQTVSSADAASSTFRPPATRGRNDDAMTPIDENQGHSNPSAQPLSTVISRLQFVIRGHQRIDRAQGFRVAAL